MPSGLAALVRERSERALRLGALRPIRTSAEQVEDGGVRFVLRVVDSLARKADSRGARGGDTPKVGSAPSPFLSPEPELLVGELSPTHCCLLNKFNVLDHHLLVVTRAFREQDLLLDETDLEALLGCMAELDGLGFYNGGAIAGASQPHKHLQLAPFPLATGVPGAPIEGALEPVLERGRAVAAPSLPFAHGCLGLEPGVPAAAVLEGYLELLRFVGLEPGPARPGARQPGPYNLLLTRRWMLLVPRSRECFQSVSVNAIGYAGGLLVRDRRELELVRRAGPMEVLRQVGRPGLRARGPRRSG